MKSLIKVIGAGIILSALFGGCTKNIGDLEKDKQVSIEKEISYKKTFRQSPTKRLMNRKIEANFVNSSVHYAVSQIAKSQGIPFDKSFVPASDYKVTVNYSGTFGGFLDLIYNETGIKYRYRNGVLSVFNKNEVDEGYKARGCGKGGKKIKMSFNNVSPEQVFKYFSDKYGFSFTFDMKYYSLNDSSGDKLPLPSVSFYYKGCDLMDALRQFIRATDLAMKVTSRKHITIKDHVTAEIDMPTYYNIDYVSNDTGLSGSDGGSSSGGSTLSSRENFKEEFSGYIKTHLSSKGTVYISNRGYLVVEDKPSVIRSVRKLVRTERRRQAAIKLTVNIIRVDVNNDLSLGVDWSQALKKVADKWGFEALVASVNYSSKVGDGLSIGGTKDGLNHLLKALQVYGNAKIARDYQITTRSGILSTFKVVDKIPYITTSVVTSNGTSEIATEAKVAEAGLVISLTPSLSEKGEIVNIATNIKVSEYQGDKIFTVNGDKFRLPKLSESTISVPAKVHMNESLILTGFKLRHQASTKEGVPGASQMPNMLGGLFGHNKKEGSVSEYLIVITPEKVTRY